MKRLKLMFVLLAVATTFVSPAVIAGVSDKAAETALRKKLKTIIIPKIAFVDTRVSTVFDFLKQASRQQDPDATGVNFLLILKPKKQAAATDKNAALVEEWAEPTVTIDMDKIPLGDAIRFVCTKAGLDYVVEPHAVVVTAKGVTRKKLELRIFTIDPRILKDVKDVKKFFEEKGVEFPVSGG